MTIDEFENGFWKKNPNGLLKATYELILFHIDKFKDYRGDDLTFESIERKYDEYLSFYISKFGQREEQYIGEKNKKKTIYDFVTEQMYKQFFDASTFFPERDPYLFGTDSLKELDEKYNKFKQGIANERNKIQ